MKSVRGKAARYPGATSSFRSAMAGVALASALGGCSGDDARTLHVDGGASGAGGGTSGGTGETAGTTSRFDAGYHRPDASSSPDAGRGASGHAGSPGESGVSGGGGSGAHGGGGTAGAGGRGAAGVSGAVGNGGLAGNGGSAGASGAGGATGAVCGNGKVEPGEECDDGNTLDMDDCTSVCTDNTACLACLQHVDGCVHDPSGCAGGACDTAPYCSDYKDATARQACYSVLACAVRTQCMFSSPDPNIPAGQYCLCGTMDPGTCQDKDSMHLNELIGPCSKEIVAAYKLNAGPSFTGSLDGAGIFNSITDVSIPAGGAMAIAVCQAEHVCGSDTKQFFGKCQCLTDHTKRVTQCGTVQATGGSGSGGAGTGGKGNGGSGMGGSGTGGSGNGGSGNGGVSSGGSGNGGSGVGGSGNGGMSSGGSGMGGSGTGGSMADPSCGPPFAAGAPQGFQGVPATPNTPTTCATCESDPMHCPRDASGCAAGTCDTQPFCSDYASAADQAACTAVQRCLRQTGCISLSSTRCFCGDNDINTCTGSLSGPIGVCKDVIIAGFPAGTNAAAMLSGLVDVSSPAGGAMALATCDHDNCLNECVPYCK